ncbi:HAD-like protein [Glarea lozoyensis ATCC 20868]|uniref:Mitochondrial import inner membrane translocase subunit TIM50 n=1 Tax=Glarea lozoyensis (strain ATCC 20868 / MF5171) TaxID=1116229 RepID=S3CZF3_GLAL2|nr:HAD-like protein [Glarea lozoyensis ATCC 20868]EPE31647.1 HAD-like protein [Glarea lozoyensis ATCC 20868]
MEDKTEEEFEALIQTIGGISISKDTKNPIPTTSSSSSNPTNTPEPHRTPVPSSQTPAKSNLTSPSQPPQDSQPQKAKTTSARKKKKNHEPDSSPFNRGTNQFKGKSTKGSSSKMVTNHGKPKMVPSWESGGVPDPSPEYLTNASTIPHQLQVPQHLLVVIDLNGTILFRPSRLNPKSYIARPNALRFLQYCIETFSVVIWSSARPDNVNFLVNVIIPPALCKKIVAVWARDKFNLTPRDYVTRVQCYKRLTRVWQDPTIAQTHPHFNMGARWDQTNTVLIDDSMEKARSEPYNLIEVPEFLGEEHEHAEILPQVHHHLNYLAMQSNVSASLKMFPFRAVSAPGNPQGVAPLDSQLGSSGQDYNHNGDERPATGLGLQA